MSGPSVVTLSDGRLLSCSEDKTLRIRNATTETELRSHDSWVYSVVTLPDGQLASCFDDNTLRVWNAITGDSETILIGHDGAVIALPDGRLVSRDWYGGCLLWSPVEYAGFRGETINVEQLERLSTEAASSGVN